MTATIWVLMCTVSVCMESALVVMITFFADTAVLQFALIAIL